MQVPVPGAFYSLLERIRTGSIVAPMLALTFVVGLYAFLTTWASTNERLVWMLWGVFTLCVVATLGAYIYWAINEPDRLQTEDYRLARHKLDLIGDERDPNSMRLLSAPPTANTHVEASR